MGHAVDLLSKTMAQLNPDIFNMVPPCCQVGITGEGDSNAASASADAPLTVGAGAARRQRLTSHRTDVVNHACDRLQRLQLEIQCLEEEARLLKSNKEEEEHGNISGASDEALQEQKGKNGIHYNPAISQQVQDDGCQGDSQQDQEEDQGLRSCRQDKLCPPTPSALAPSYGGTNTMNKHRIPSYNRDCTDLHPLTPAIAISYLL